MSEAIRLILISARDRLELQVATFLPSLLAAATVILSSLAVAIVVRLLVYRVFRGREIDRFLRRMGIVQLLVPSGRFRATRVAAETAYWAILAAGILSGVSVFGTDLTAQLVSSFVFLAPRLVLAVAVVLVGIGLSQYLARCALVWAFNESLPCPRRIALSIRVLTVFVAVVVAADYINFAPDVFIAAFILCIGGLVMTLSLAFGIGASQSVQSYLDQKRNAKADTREKEEFSLWSHL